MAAEQDSEVKDEQGSEVKDEQGSEVKDEQGSEVKDEQGEDHADVQTGEQSDEGGQADVDDLRENASGTSYGEDESQDYVDRDKLDFDPEDGLYTGTAVDGTSEIPDPPTDEEVAEEQRKMGLDETGTVNEADGESHNDESPDDQSPDDQSHTDKSHNDKSHNDESPDGEPHEADTPDADTPEGKSPDRPKPYPT